MPEAARNAPVTSPTPSAGGEGSDLRSVAGQIEGLLDDEGHFNPDPEQLSRGHPDYDESADSRVRDRDERGRFRKQETRDEQETSDDSQSEDEDADVSGDTAAADDADTDEDAGDTADDDAASADDEAETSEADTDGIGTLEDLAAALEVPLDELQEQLTHTFKAADEEVTVTLSELVKGYQKDADYRRSTAKLAEERRKVEADFNERMQKYEQQMQLLQQQFNTAEQIVLADANSPDLAALRDTDPAEWAARREEIGDKVAAIRQAQAQTAAAYEQYRTEALQQLKETEMAALTQAIPDWNDDTRQQALETMKSLGYSEQEIGNIYDHRSVAAAVELANLRKEVAELRKLKERAADTVKRVKKTIPKLQKPGKQKTRGVNVKRDTLARLKAQAQKSGNVRDAAKVIEQLI